VQQGPELHLQGLPEQEGEEAVIWLLWLLVSVATALTIGWLLQPVEEEGDL
jgi:hypothetical protein